jgi:SpoVK/Ycf46/Vps4 family AAA+-type ATPase
MGGRIVVNDLLTHLDLLDTNSSIYIIGSTNAPWLLDAAILRSGRISTLLYVGVPDEATRASLLRHYTRNLPIGNVNFEALARKTEFYSCADIASLCYEAASFPMMEALEGGKERPISQEDFEKALCSVTSTAIPWFENALSLMPFQESFAARFEPMIREIERYRRWKKKGPYGASYG